MSRHPRFPLAQLLEVCCDLSPSHVENGEPDNDFVRLEVSGIARGHGLAGRLQVKVSQLARVDLERPGLAVVVGFEAAQIHVDEVLP